MLKTACVVSSVIQCQQAVGVYVDCPMRLLCTLCTVPAGCWCVCGLSYAATVYLMHSASRLWVCVWTVLCGYVYLLVLSVDVDVDDLRRIYRRSVSHRVARSRSVWLCSRICRLPPTALDENSLLLVISARTIIVAATSYYRSRRPAVAATPA